MLQIDRELLEKTFYRLVSAQSISGTWDENKSTDEIKACFDEMPYFQQHPDYLKAFPIPNDVFGREVVTALVKGDGSSNKTIVMIGHSDVVDASDYGINEDVAFEPKTLMARMKNVAMNPDAKKTLNQKNGFLDGVSWTCAAAWPWP